MRKTALFVGEPMIELIPGPTGDTARMGVAGDVLNAAIYMRAAATGDWDISLVTALGRDALSARITDFAAAHGLRTDRILRHPDRGPGLYAISVDAAGERSFTYWRSQSAARVMFGPDSGLDFGALADADLIFFSAITLAILSTAARDGFLGALREKRTGGTRLAFDSNYRPRLWEDAETARTAIRTAHDLADIAFPSLDDEMAVFGGTEDETVARLRAHGAPVCILKRGDRGPLIVSPPAAGSATGWPKAPVVRDTTGAGDAFSGTALAKLMSGAAPAAAAAAGHEVARRVVGVQGAILPTTPGPVD